MSVIGRRYKWWLLALGVGVLLAYLRDPPWLGRVTSGFGRWEQNGAGVRFHWMGGRASFFVPADAESLEIPLHALFPPSNSEPFIVDIAVDGRQATQVVLRDERWVTAKLPIRSARQARRFRRIDLRANRTWSERSVSVQVGDVTIRH